jgi:hypothetical protein
VLPGGPALEYLRLERPDLLKHLGASAANVGASWETARPSFVAAAEPNVGVGHAGDLYRGLSVAWKALKFTRLPQPSIRSVGMVKINPRAFPGVVSSRLGSSRKKVFAVSAEIAKEAYREAAKRFVPDVSLWGCGGRGKYAMKATPGASMKSRLVLMPETPSTLLESAFAQPFTEMVSKVGGDIMLGASMTDRGYMRLVNAFRGIDHCKAYDWSGFDSRVREDMIVSAFGVVRACYFGDDAHLDNVFLRFMSHFIIKQVVVPGGWVYTLAKGIPSGSPFTSIIDSIVNWLVLVDLEVTMGGLSAPRKNSRKVYGDDFVVGFRAPCLEKAEFISLAYTRWGFIAKPTAAYEGPFTTTSASTSLPFLSYRFPLELPARPVEDALQLALVPYTARLTYSAQLQRVIYLDHFSPYDFEMSDYHRRYFLWIISRTPGAAFKDSPIQESLVTYWMWLGDTPRELSLWESGFGRKILVAAQTAGSQRNVEGSPRSHIGGQDDGSPPFRTLPGMTG